MFNDFKKREVVPKRGSYLMNVPERKNNLDFTTNFQSSLNRYDTEGVDCLMLVDADVWQRLEDLPIPSQPLTLNNTELIEKLNNQLKKEPRSSYYWSVTLAKYLPVSAYIGLSTTRLTVRIGYAIRTVSLHDIACYERSEEDDYYIVEKYAFIVSKETFQILEPHLQVTPSSFDVYLERIESILRSRPKPQYWCSTMQSYQPIDRILRVYYDKYGIRIDFQTNGKTRTVPYCNVGPRSGRSRVVE